MSFMALRRLRMTVSREQLPTREVLSKADMARAVLAYELILDLGKTACHAGVGTGKRFRAIPFCIRQEVRKSQSASLLSCRIPTRAMDNKRSRPPLRSRVHQQPASAVSSGPEVAC